MSVIFDMSKQDLIGARIVDVDAREDGRDLFDFGSITLELMNGAKARINIDVNFAHDGEVYAGASLDVTYLTTH